MICKCQWVAFFLKQISIICASVIITAFSQSVLQGCSLSSSQGLCLKNVNTERNDLLLQSHHSQPRVGNKSFSFFFFTFISLMQDTYTCDILILGWCTKLEQFFWHVHFLSEWGKFEIHSGAGYHDRQLQLMLIRSQICYAMCIYAICIYAMWIYAMWIYDMWISGARCCGLSAPSYSIQTSPLWSISRQTAENWTLSAPLHTPEQCD